MKATEPPKATLTNGMASTSSNPNLPAFSYRRIISRARVLLSKDVHNEEVSLHRSHSWALTLSAVAIASPEQPGVSFTFDVKSDGEFDLKVDAILAPGRTIEEARQILMDTSSMTAMSKIIAGAHMDMSGPDSGTLYTEWGRFTSTNSSSPIAKKRRRPRRGPRTAHCESSRIPVIRTTRVRPARFSPMVERSPLAIKVLPSPTFTASPILLVGQSAENLVSQSLAAASRTRRGELQSPRRSTAPVAGELRLFDLPNSEHLQRQPPRQPRSGDGQSNGWRN